MGRVTKTEREHKDNQKLGDLNVYVDEQGILREGSPSSNKESGSSPTERSFSLGSKIEGPIEGYVVREAILSRSGYNYKSTSLSNGSLRDLNLACRILRRYGVSYDESNPTVDKAEKQFGNLTMIDLNNYFKEHNYELYR